MFRITGQPEADCEGIRRRSFLQAGVLGVGGLSLADLGRLTAEADAGKGLDDRSVILFWLSGGPGHMETWDPKPEAVAQYRGPFGAVQTAVPGMLFGELMPELAKVADKLAVVRGVRHRSGDHTKGNHWMLTGYEGPAFNAPDNKVQRRPSMGSAVARTLGQRVRGMPPYAAVPHLRGGTDNLFHYAAYLGGGCNPFIVNSDPNTTSYRVRNLALPGDMSFRRLESRRLLLETIDRYRRNADRGMIDMSAHQQSAFDLLTSRQVKSAFDIAAEADNVRDAYGRHTFGQSALLARRLVEHGVRFVTVNCVPWDHHGTSGRYRTDVGGRKLIPPLDVAMAALVRDLLVRGLYDRTLIVAMGEFGRTPKMNSAGGRDHWGHTFSVLFGGGGLNLGQPVGSSDDRGAYVKDRPVDPQDIAATVYRFLGIDGRRTTYPDNTGRPMHLIDHGEPIRELLG